MHARHTRRDCLRFLGAAAAGAATAPARGAELQPWPARAAAPALETVDLQGRAWQLPLAGRAVALNFWASWCEPCRAEMPTLRTLADLYSDQLTVLALNFKERPSTVARFAQQTGTTLPILLDPLGDHARAWGVKVFPTTILIAPDGRPRWRVRGEWDWSSAEAGRVVEGLWR
jgi:thiol-disulfide isomerase/thioredoxin